MKRVVALGGNALAAPGGAEGALADAPALRAAARALAALAHEGALVVTHGNGPQVGWLALQAAALGADAPPDGAALDALGAESEGLVGYWIERELAPLLPGRELATLLTQVEVDPDDPAFSAPSKPIGPRIDPRDEGARRSAERRGWVLAPVDGGRALRRVVPSPEPRRVRERRAIELLSDAGVVVICAGGGGIPVVATSTGGLRGVEAVVDKDLASALLARELGADALLLLTDAPAVWLDWPRPCRRAVARADPAALRAHAFEAGSMGPKVEAACRFVEGGGALAAIGALADAPRLLRGEAGTVVRAGIALALHDPAPPWPRPVD